MDNALGEKPAPSGGHDHPPGAGVAGCERGRPRGLLRALYHPERVPEQAVPFADRDSFSVALDELG